MPKCENCYHHDICIFHGASGCERCMQYKDKSLIVELPCKVGDEVWIIFDDTKTVESRWILSIKMNKNRITLTFTNGSCFTIWSGYCEDYFGESIFLTREEAEKALRERENNE